MHKLRHRVRIAPRELSIIAPHCKGLIAVMDVRKDQSDENALPVYYANYALKE